MCKIPSDKIRLVILFVAITGLFAQPHCSAQMLPKKCFDNQSDYSFMWWKKTIKTGNQVFAIKTNHYSFSFDNLNLSIQNLSINNSSKPEESVLRETNAESFPADIPCQLNFGMNSNGYQTWCETSSGSVHDCQLIETGKYFQRRFINRLPIPGLVNCDEYYSGLEISSWPDRLAFILRAVPVSDLCNAGAEMNLSFPSNYSVPLSYGDVVALKDPSDGSGFILLKSANSTSISLSGTKVSVVLETIPKWTSGTERNTGLIIYPVAAGIDSRIIEIAEQEASPLLVIAEQIAPRKVALEVDYNKDLGWHQIRLRNDETPGRGTGSGNLEDNPDPNSVDSHNRMERVKFTVTNPSRSDRILRLNFAKGRLVQEGESANNLLGISSVFRDMDGNPVGIPIQLSKNWHSGGRTERDAYFRGPWYHGFSMLTIPASSSITLEYTSVNSLWGGVPAASHAQLCLVGWGYNQQWDQAAIGAWGENITYEPDLHQAHAPVLDFRPLFLHSPSGKKWGWTGNIGGADFFNYTKTNGTRGWHSRIRTQYKRYCPNITEVTYTGTMDDNSMDFEYTTSVERSDDITRGIYKIKLNVLKNTEFKDFVIFQAAAATYHQTKGSTLAWGNNSGLITEWKASIGGDPGYTTDRKKIEGNVPWFSFTDSENTFKPQEGTFLSANRGFVIKKWKARIEGKEDASPWFAEYNTAGGNFGDPSALINILPPEGCTSFKEGDFIEAEIVLFILPQKAGDYYGPNQNFAKALSEKVNTWEMVYREAIGNDIDVTVSKGTLMDDFPIKIKADNNKALFSLKGGLGYTPLTICNLDNYKNPELFRKAGGKWQMVDQQVHGNDFWQTEYNVSTGTWDITYNVNLDTPGDERQFVEFRFGN